MTVIDVHTHMLSQPWFELLKTNGAPRFEVRPSKDHPAPLAIFAGGGVFMTPQPGHYDYDLRVQDMNKARVDMAIVSLTCPNVYWGGPDVSLEAARVVNDDMAAAQTAFPDRIRWLASLPWEYTDAAIVELDRACDHGAVGVMVLANVAGRPLTAPGFAAIWQAIDERALPVLVHPTTPPGVGAMDMQRFNLIAQIGFMFDTSLAIARMIYDGFFDRYPNLKVIASHGGGALPYLVGRLDQCYDTLAEPKENIQAPPSEYLRRIYYDAVVYRQEALQMCLSVAGEDRVMYGSDYPHNIGDMKGCLGRVNELRGNLPKVVRGANAARIFRL